MSGQKDEESGIIGKAAWVAAEALGNAARITGGGRGVQDSGRDGKEERVITNEEAVMRLRADYERDYFISGKVDADLYEEDCLFAGGRPCLCNTSHLDCCEWMLGASTS